MLDSQGIHVPPSINHNNKKLSVIYPDSIYHVVLAVNFSSSPFYFPHIQIRYLETVTHLVLY